MNAPPKPPSHAAPPPPAPDDRPAGPGRTPGAQPVQYTRAWMLFLMSLCLLVAWAIPLRMWLGHVIWPPVQRGPATATAFMALAYEGVSAKTNEVNPRQFREHINALKEHGYVPVSLREVRALYRENQPLPPKAVLLTFDHSRKTSFYETKSFLRRAGWNAVMFLWVKPIDDEDPAALLWPYVRTLARSPNWEIAAQSYNGFALVPTDPFGDAGHFMTSREWFARESRYETLDEMVSRLKADHQRCLDEILEETAQLPLAYAYPYGDFGQFMRREQQIKKINQNLVGRYYDVGFLTGNFACNTRFTDPRRLNRMRVNPAWSGADLVSILDRSWPRNEAIAYTNAEATASAWIVDWGSMEVARQRLVLQSSKNEPGQPAPPQGSETMATNEATVADAEAGDEDWLVLLAREDITGARMWLAPSSMRQDFYWKIVFRLVDGQMGIFLRGSPDEEQFVYFGIDTRGSVWLRQKYAGLPPFTLASRKVRFFTTADHVLEVYLRGPLFGAVLDGQPVFDERTELRGEPAPGMLGISVWDTERGKARLEIADITLSEQEPTLAYWHTDETAEPFSTRWIHENGFRLTHLSPSWLEISPGGRLSQMTTDWTIPQLLARIYNLKFMPHMDVRDDNWEGAMAPNQLLRSVEEVKADGLLIDFSQIKPMPLAPVTAWLKQLWTLFEDQGLQLLVRWPKALETSAMIQPVFAVIPNLQIAVAGDSPIKAGLPGANATPVVAEDIPAPANPGRIPKIYQIRPPSEESKELTTQERIRTLQQEGKSALTANRPQEAIDLWKQWRALAPNDPIPRMLIGDVYARLGDYDQALQYFQDSLFLDPGRVSLAMRRANLLDEMGRSDEAIQAMNLYARLFPENTDVLMAQASWYDRHGQRAKARELLQHALELRPDDLRVVVVAARLADTPEERQASLARILAFRDRPELYMDLGDAIQQHELLAMPGAAVLTPLIDAICDTSSNQQVVALFQQFKGLPEPVRDTFAMGRLSESWRMGGGLAMPDNQGRFQIRTDGAHKELFVQLNGAELTRNGQVAATLVGNAGEFWLVAKRGWKHYIRFGFDVSGMLYLQIWIDGRLVANQKRFWMRGADALRMRLDVRGYGAMGYINDKPAFEAPVIVPRDLWAGYWGISIFAPEPGQALASLNEISVAPLPLEVALLPPPSEKVDPDQLISVLRPMAGVVSALAPRWFFWQPNGQLERYYQADDDLVTILARFHGMELLPAIEMSERLEIQPEALIKKAEEFRLDGFILLFSMMPDEAWFQKYGPALESAPLDILVVVPDAAAQAARVRALGPASTFFSGRGPVHTMRWMSWPNPQVADAAGLAAITENTVLQLDWHAAVSAVSNALPAAVGTPTNAPVRSPKYFESKLHEDSSSPD